MQGGTLPAPSRALLSRRRGWVARNSPQSLRFAPFGAAQRSTQTGLLPGCCTSASMRVAVELIRYPPSADGFRVGLQWEYHFLSQLPLQLNIEILQYVKQYLGGENFRSILKTLSGFRKGRSGRGLSEFRRARRLFGEPDIRRQGERYLHVKQGTIFFNEGLFFKEVTSAKVHDSKPLFGLLGKARKSNEPVWGDSAYRSKEIEKKLK